MQDDESIIYIYHTRFILKIFTGHIQPIDTTDLRHVTQGSTERSTNLRHEITFQSPFLCPLGTNESFSFY